MQISIYMLNCRDGIIGIVGGWSASEIIDTLKCNFWKFKILNLFDNEALKKVRSF